MQETKWYTVEETPSIVFEDTKVGRMKKEIWDEMCIRDRRILRGVPHISF